MANDPTQSAHISSTSAQTPQAGDIEEQVHALYRDIEIVFTTAAKNSDGDGDGAPDCLSVHALIKWFDLDLVARIMGGFVLGPDAFPSVDLDDHFLVSLLTQANALARKMASEDVIDAILAVNVEQGQYIQGHVDRGYSLISVECSSDKAGIDGLQEPCVDFFAELFQGHAQIGVEETIDGQTSLHVLTEGQLGADPLPLIRGAMWIDIGVLGQKGDASVSFTNDPKRMRAFVDGLSPRSRATPGDRHDAVLSLIEFELEEALQEIGCDQAEIIIEDRSGHETEPSLQVWCSIGKAHGIVDCLAIATALTHSPTGLFRTEASDIAAAKLGH